jgi:FkbM family methyltransferase
MIKPVLRKITPQAIREIIHPPAPQFLESYAQEGEDMVLRRFLEGRATPGFFVDVGAHHPVRFSNTYFFYKQGWRGINIDAMPGSMEPFKKVRPRDINIEAAVAQESRELTYSIFNDPALNGFDAELSETRDKLAGYHIVQRVKIQTQTLAQILEQNLPAGTKIDFLTVDVEGFDLQVLASNDWTRFRPELVLAEDTAAAGGAGTWNHVEKSPISTFLRSQNYTPWACTGFTVFYKSVSAI